MSNFMSDLRLPTVSIVVPTYNRHAFIPQLLRGIRNQDYPQSLIEVVIYDDSPVPLVITEQAQQGLTLRLHHSPQKRTIAQKRNFLNAQASGEIIVAFDDDDYYPPTRVSHAVARLTASGLALAGSTLLLMWFPKACTDNALFLLGPFGANHSCNGAFAYTRAYAQSHRYDESRKSGEEPAFTCNFTEPMVQLDPIQTMLAIAHAHNTVPKHDASLARYRLPNPDQFPEYHIGHWTDLVTDAASQDFYRQHFGIN